MTDKLTVHRALPVYDWTPIGERVSKFYPDGLMIAIIELKRAGTTYFDSEKVPDIALTIHEHPDCKSIIDWLITHGEDGNVLRAWGYLANSVRGEWAILPRRGAAKHTSAFAKVQKRCAELKTALFETGADYNGGGGRGLRNARVINLLTQQESGQLLENEGDESSIFRLELSVLMIEELLDRLASEAVRLSGIPSTHPQPEKRGAERGYFVRRMGELFQQRYGEQPHEVIAALTTIALGEATDRELVAKLLN